MLPLQTLATRAADVYDAMATSPKRPRDIEVAYNFARVLLEAGTGELEEAAAKNVLRAFRAAEKASKYRPLTAFAWPAQRRADDLREAANDHCDAPNPKELARWAAYCRNFARAVASSCRAA